MKKLSLSETWTPHRRSSRQTFSTAGPTPRQPGMVHRKSPASNRSDRALFANQSMAVRQAESPQPSYWRNCHNTRKHPQGLLSSRTNWHREIKPGRKLKITPSPRRNKNNKTSQMSSQRRLKKRRRLVMMWIASWMRHWRR